VRRQRGLVLLLKAPHLGVTLETGCSILASMKYWRPNVAFASFSDPAHRTSMMGITQDSVVSIHYTLKDGAGEVIDRSAAGMPLAYLHGRGTLVPGLERELAGKVAGDKLNIKLAAADGYGEYDERLVRRVPRESLRGIPNLAVGMRLHAQTHEGQQAVTVSEIGADTVTIDGNHPLAGKDLSFEIEIADVRDATEEELSHGHVHGPGGHHHS